MGGKRRGGEPHLTAGRTGNQAVSLRDESSGKTTRVDEASVLRVKHLQQLAAWTGAEAGVGPVGALLGRRLAASAEVARVPIGPATFLCQRFVVPSSDSCVWAPRLGDYALLLTELTDVVSRSRRVIPLCLFLVFQFNFSVNLLLASYCRQQLTCSTS
jgi:hypothetical protein